MFNPEDNHYSRFIDALQVCDEKYLDSDECKKHYNKNWWLKYNCLAVKESTKNITIFNRIPKEILKHENVIPFLTNVSKEIFNEYYKHIDYVNVCKLWLHKDTTDEIKEMCSAMEEKHINNIKQWVHHIIIYKQLDDEYEKIVQNSITNLSEDMFKNFYNMQLAYGHVTNTKKKNGYIKIPNCLNTILKNDNLETFKQHKFLMDKVKTYLYFTVKYKSTNIVKYIISYDYNKEDYEHMLSITHCTDLDESSIKFMLQYLPINPYMRRDKRNKKLLLNKYMKNYKDNELKKVNKICKSMRLFYIDRAYIYEINKLIQLYKPEIENKYDVEFDVEINKIESIFYPPDY